MKQTYQQLGCKFPLPVVSKKDTENHGQKYWDCYVYNLPFAFLCGNFLHVQKRNGNPSVPNVYKSGIVQEKINAIHQKFFVPIRTIGPFIITQFQRNTITELVFDDISIRNYNHLVGWPLFNDVFQFHGLDPVFEHGNKVTFNKDSQRLITIGV